MGRAARFRVRCRGEDTPLVRGDFVIGRAAGSDLRLDDALVSRRHAILHVERDQVSVEDVGSRNGILVNGDPISGKRPLAHGDWLVIGGYVIALIEESRAGPSSTASEADSAPRTSSSDKPPPAESAGEHAITGSGSLFQIMLRGCQRALAEGNLPAAEGNLDNLVRIIGARAGQGEVPDPDVVAELSRLALRLATKSQQSRWIDRLFEVHTSLRRILPTNMLDTVESTVREVGRPSATAVDAYVRSVRSRPGLSDWELALLDRAGKLAS